MTQNQQAFHPPLVFSKENLIFFLGDQPEVKDEVIFKLLKNESHNSKILIPQYRYKLGFPILTSSSNSS